MSTTAAAVNERNRRDKQKKATAASTTKKRAAVAPSITTSSSLNSGHRSIDRMDRSSPTPGEQEDSRHGVDFKTPTGALTSIPDTANYEMRKKAVQNRGSTEPRMQRFLAWWVIDPRVSKILGAWDILTMVALFFVALITPLEVTTQPTHSCHA